MRLSRVWVAAIGLALAGCGGPTNQSPTVQDMRQTALSDVAELCRVYQSTSKKAPTKVADFLPLEPQSPMGVNAIKTGAVIVRFGAELPDLSEEPSKVGGDEVLAYEKEVPTSGGQVLMLNRTIQTMTAEQFKAAKLAGTSSSEGSTGTAGTTKK